MAKKQWYISPVEQFNIDSIRKDRLDLNVSTKEISDFLGKNDQYIAHHESPSHNATYSDDTMTLVAIYLTRVAKKIQKENEKANIKKRIKTDYTILDFYPKKSLADIKVLKSIAPIAKTWGSAGTLNWVLETTSFFDEIRTLADIIIHCNQLQNQEWTGSDFTQTLDRLVKKGRLKVKTLTDGIYGYYKPKEKN